MRTGKVHEIAHALGVARVEVGDHHRGDGNEIVLLDELLSVQQFQSLIVLVRSRVHRGCFDAFVSLSLARKRVPFDLPGRRIPLQGRRVRSEGRRLRKGRGVGGVHNNKCKMKIL